jgi:hypothetical protein
VCLLCVGLGCFWFGVVGGGGGRGPPGGGGESVSVRECV